MNQSPDFTTVLKNLPWYERAIAAVAPRAATERLRARFERHSLSYQAAVADRLYAPKTWGTPSESTITQRDRVVMMWEARNLVENFPPAKAAISRYGTFLTPTEYAPATGNRDYDALVADWFHTWCKRCDITGRHSFRKLIQLAVEMRPADGDCGMIIVRSGKELKLQLVSSDRIGNPNELTYGDQDPNKPHYYSGITTDARGKPVSYRIYTLTQVGNYLDPVEVPAENFLHYFDPFRVDQYRGISDFHSVARHAQMLKGILEAELAGVRFASQNAALVFTERGQAASRNIFTPANAQPMSNGELPKHEQSDIANIQYLYSGDKVQVMPSRPGASFQGFVQEVMHEIALGLGGYPAGVLWGTQDFKGPSVRAEFAQADRVNSRHQGILCDKMLDPAKNAVILDAIARGELPLPPRAAGETVEQAITRATRGSFRFPPRLTIDVGRESAARISELNNGAGSLQEIASEDGKDAYTRLEEKAQAAAWIKALAEKYDIPETAIILPGGMLPSTPAAAAAIGEKAGEDAAAAQAESVAQPAPQENALDNALMMAVDNGGYIPTAAMAENAKRALKVRQEKPQSQRGMTAVGLARARDIQNRRSLSYDTVKRMKSYFDRHEVDKDGETWDTQGKGWQAWNGWGGDEGRTWANRIVEAENRKEELKGGTKTDRMKAASGEVIDFLLAVDQTNLPKPGFLSKGELDDAHKAYSSAVGNYRTKIYDKLERELNQDQQAK
jgi:capsid protein